MKKSVISIATIMMAASMAVSMPVFAAGSPTTRTAGSTAVSSQSVVKEIKPYIIPYEGSEIKVADLGISADFSGLANADYVNTAIKADPNSDAAKLLNEYARLLHAGSRYFGPIQIQMYNAGVSLQDNYGDVVYRFNVGKQYDGQIATVYQIVQSGKSIIHKVRVVNGIVEVKASQAGTFSIVL